MIDIVKNRLMDFLGFDDPEIFEGYMDTLPSSEVGDLLAKFKRSVSVPDKIAPPDMIGWRKALFPQFTSYAPHHDEVWRWFWDIELGKPAKNSLVVCLGRGGGKTATNESVIVALAGRMTRKYILYIQSVQQQANDTVQNIVDNRFRNSIVNQYYPELGRASVRWVQDGEKKKVVRGKWKQKEVETESGVVLKAFGLGSAMRGEMRDDKRPDMIFFDDIDEEHDSNRMVGKKIDTIKRAILPLGSPDCVIVFTQNLIHRQSIMSRIVDGTADFLLDAKVIGPVPFVNDLEYRELVGEEALRLSGQRRYYQITSGTPTWDRIGIKECERFMNKFGLTSFLQEQQHEVNQVAGGLFNHLDFERITWAELPRLVDVVGVIDPAVTSNEQSDCQAIQFDGLGVDGLIYRLFSWEAIASPESVLEKAFIKAVELNCKNIFIETNQGGDTWDSVVKAVVSKLKKNHKSLPDYHHVKATRSTGGKVERATPMLADYEMGRIIHVTGTNRILENALYRFPKNKPFDLVDAAAWSWHKLRQVQRNARAGHSAVKRVKIIKPNGRLP